LHNPANKQTNADNNIISLAAVIILENADYKNNVLPL